jgi:hypothetical protein
LLQSNVTFFPALSQVFFSILQERQVKGMFPLSIWNKLRLIHTPEQGTNPDFPLVQALGASFLESWLEVMGIVQGQEQTRTFLILASHTP